MNIMEAIKQYVFLLIFAMLLSTDGCRSPGTFCDSSIQQRLLPHERNSVGMTLVQLPSGTFMMGAKHEGSRPVHTVVLSSFWISAYDITNAQFELFRRRGRPPESLGDRQPVTRIGYADAVDFCKWLTKKEHKCYRLPTEAEWEYAARGGLVQKDYPWGDGDPQGRATITIPFSTSLNMTTTPVGAHAPNGYELYDMAGNVFNWTSDWFDESYYAHSPLHNPKGPLHPVEALHGRDTSKVTRGGAFDVGDCYVWLRNPAPLDIVPDLTKMSSQDQQDGSGFRVVLEAETK